MSKTITPEQFLHTTNRERSRNPLVENTAKIAERRGSKSGNAEAKLGAFISRVTEIEQKPSTKERLLGLLVKNMVVQQQDIPEAYWRQQEKLARDNGLGDITIDSRKKQYLARQLQDAQRTGIESWTNYLEETGDQYPTWFKLYAAEGMSKLGIFDKEKGFYRTRSKGTVAPYPPLNPAALARTYDIIDEYLAGTSPDDETIARLVKGGNFNKIYSHYLFETSTTISTPERAEDVQGEWREYTKEDVEGIMQAAQNTPWCIAGRGMVERYTEDGSFYLFHLQDPETGQFSQTASASVRMQNGKVAEVSGLEDGSAQRIEDALVPTVMEKVHLLPGGERYGRAFEDKQQLIDMDRKFHAEPREAFTNDELRFLYEIDRRIEYIDTYAHGRDQRPEEFKSDPVVYEQLKEEFGEAIARVATLDDYEVAQQLDALLDDRDIPVGMLMSRIGSDVVVDNLEKLLVAGAVVDINALLDDESDSGVNFAGNIDKLLAAGADVDKLVARLRSYEVLDNLTKFITAGAKIDIDELADSLNTEELVDNLDKLLAAGAKIDVAGIVNKMEADDDYYRSTANENLDKLLAAGADPTQIASLIGDYSTADNLDKLLATGAKIDVSGLLDRLGTEGIADNLDKLLAAGVEINIQDLVRRVNGGDIFRNISQFLAAGADPDALVAKIHPASVARHLDKLLAAGAVINIPELLDRLGPEDILRSIDKLLAAGAYIDVDVLMDQVKPLQIVANLDPLVAAGVQGDAIIEKLGPTAAAVMAADKLHNRGVEIDVDTLVDRLDAELVERLQGKLLVVGANPDKLAKRLEVSEELKRK